MNAGYTKFLPFFRITYCKVSRELPELVAFGAYFPIWTTFQIETSLKKPFKKVWKISSFLTEMWTKRGNMPQNLHELGHSIGTKERCGVSVAGVANGPLKIHHSGQKQPKIRQVWFKHKKMNKLRRTINTNVNSGIYQARCGSLARACFFVSDASSQKNKLASNCHQNKKVTLHMQTDE